MLNYNVNPRTPEAMDLMLQGTLALGHAERHGLCIDLDYCERTQKSLGRRMDRLHGKLEETDLFKLWRRTYPGEQFNSNSDQQLGNILYKHMGLEPTKTTEKGTASVDKEALEATGLIEIPTLLEYRKLDKLLNTYFASVVREQVDGFLHPFFNLNRVTTFRSSSDSPNFQNFPKRDAEVKKYIRQAITARPDHRLLAIDYSGVEVKIAATYHNDPTMIKYLLDPGSDMHRDVACDAFFLKAAWWKECQGTEAGKWLNSMRQTAKNKFTFPEFYGDYFVACAKSMWTETTRDDHKLPDGTPVRRHLASKGIRNLKDFTEHIKKVEDIFWNKRFKVYTQWKDDWFVDYTQNGYFDSKTGFRYQGTMDKNKVINYAVQGSAFHCLLKAFIETWQMEIKKKWKSKLVAQIHDEMLLDVHKDEFDYVLEDCVNIMSKRVPKLWPWINVPLEVEAEATPVGGTWFEMDDIKL